MSLCNYKKKYFDYTKKEPTNFECSEEALTTGFCIFHDSEYNNDQEIIKKLEGKIKVANKEPLFFIGYKIPKMKLSGSFSHPVYFTRATIKDGDFSGAKFENVDFSGAKFGNIDFTGSTFESAYFLAIKCNGVANFSQCVFKKTVNFSESFFNNIIFSDSSISKGQFLGINFKNADFGLSKIEDSDFYAATFGETTFIGSNIIRTRFPNAKFEGRVNFTGAKIEKTNFFHTNFTTINFDQATLEVVGFQNNSFSGNATFASAQLEKVTIHNPNFKKNVNFNSADFDKVIIAEGIFHDKADFTKANFVDVQFKSTEFQMADFSEAKFEGKTYFNDVTFKNQEKAIFRVEDLSKVSFLGTDITQVWFDENVKWAGESGFRIMDEELLNDSTKKTSLESIIATYRNLRKNYERRFRLEEADKFLEREIELKKIYHKEEPPSTVSDLEFLTQKLADLKKENEKQSDKVVKYQDILKEVLGTDSSADEPQKNNSDQINLTKKKLYDDLEKKLVWIFGTPRSGSSWLARDILRRKEIQFVRETMLGAHLGAFRDGPEIYWKLFKENYHVKLTRIIDLDKENFFFSSENEKKWLESLRILILNRINPNLGIDGPQRYVIKAPNESHASDIIMKSVPNSKLIFLIRDGRDVIDSRQSKAQNPRLGGAPESTEERKYRIAYFAMIWNKMIETTKKAYEAHNPELRLMVKYEDLRKNPIAEIGRIYKFLGYNLSDEQINNIAEQTSFENVSDELKGEDKNIRKAQPGSYKEYVTNEELKIVNEMMRKNLLAFGYKV